MMHTSTTEVTNVSCTAVPLAPGRMSKRNMVFLGREFILKGCIDAVGELYYVCKAARKLPSLQIEELGSGFPKSLELLGHPHRCM